jgi:transcriptional regulator with XRE-family HTH domain
MNTGHYPALIERAFDHELSRHLTFHSSPPRERATFFLNRIQRTSGQSSRTGRRYTRKARHIYTSIFIQDCGGPCGEVLYMKYTNKLGKFLKTRRESLGLTQRSLADKLGVEASHVAFLESGQRKPSLKLIARIADTLGLDRQEVLVLAHPETRELLTTTTLESPKKMSRSWQRFIKNHELLTQYHVTKRELQVLEPLSLLDIPLSAKELLTILMLIRDIPESK